MPAARGRPPTGSISGKSSVFTTRIRPELRAKLNQSAKEAGHSLSQEVERRLSDSFVQEGRMEDAFGSVDNYWLMRIIAVSMQDTRIPYHKANNWRTDPNLFDAVVRVMNNVLEAIRPGPPVNKSNKEVAMVEFLVRQIPIAIWQTIQQADVSLPLDKGTNDEHLAALLKRKLGGLVDDALERSRASMPDADEWRRRADVAFEIDLQEHEKRKRGRKPSK